MNLDVLIPVERCSGICSIVQFFDAQVMIDATQRWIESLEKIGPSLKKDLH